MTSYAGAIKIDLKPEFESERFWFISTKRSNSNVTGLLTKIKALHGVSDVWFIDDKNHDLFVTIDVDNASEGKAVVDTIRDYEEVKSAQLSVGTHGLPK